MGTSFSCGKSNMDHNKRKDRSKKAKAPATSKKTGNKVAGSNKGKDGNKKAKATATSEKTGTKVADSSQHKLEGDARELQQQRQQQPQLRGNAQPMTDEEALEAGIAASLSDSQSGLSRSGSFSSGSSHYGSATLSPHDIPQPPQGVRELQQQRQQQPQLRGNAQPMTDEEVIQAGIAASLSDSQAGLSRSGYSSSGSSHSAQLCVRELQQQRQQPPQLRGNAQPMTDEEALEAGIAASLSDTQSGLSRSGSFSSGSSHYGSATLSPHDIPQPQQGVRELQQQRQQQPQLRRNAQPMTDEEALQAGLAASLGVSQSGLSRSGYSSSGYSHSAQLGVSSPYTHSTVYSYQPGLCGLANLGNTCFMNSALQCLSNTQPLTEYFVGKQAAYMKHINENNHPLGMNGAIAKAYGQLLQRMWNDKHLLRSLQPGRFKAEVGKYAPRFMGYEQQDAQELLAFLLNGLHEDLNLVKEKPYVSMSVASEGRCDKDVAEESWYKYLRRNQSMIVRLLQGQLKSTLGCPECGKTKRVFDPFTYLSLPLPNETRSIKVTLMPAEHQDDAQTGLAIQQYKLNVPKRGCVADLKKELTKQTGIRADMMMIEVETLTSERRTQHTICGDHHTIMHETGIFVHELVHPLQGQHRVQHQEQHWVQVLVCHYTEEKNGSYQPFGLPVVVCVSKKQCTYRYLYQAVLQKCRKYIKQLPEIGEPMEPESEITENETTCQRNVTSNGSSVDRDAMETDENEGVQGKEMPKDATLKTDLFLLKSKGAAIKCDLVEQIKYNVTGKFQMLCVWSREVKEKHYNTQAITKRLKECRSSTGKEEDQRKSGITLSDCLDLFTAKIVGEENAWYCSDCKRPVQVSRECHLWKLPEILIIYLKRFSSLGRVKVNTMVDFPVSGLSLKSYTQNPDAAEAVYDLFATINHAGGIYGGHYTAHCKNAEKWYTFNDTAVYEMKTGQIVSATAYVLFYQRRSEGHEVNSRELTELFVEEMEQLEAKFKPRGTAATNETRKGEKKSTSEERQKREQKQKKATDTEEEKHKRITAGENREGEEKKEEEEPTSEEERGEEEGNMHVENKRGKKRREGTTGKKRSEKEGKHPEGSCNGEEEEGVESGNGSGILKEQEGERKACNRGEKQEDPMGTTKKKCTRPEA